MEKDRKIIEEAQRFIRSHFYQHPLDCNYPEGCDCGASVSNERMKKLIQNLETVKVKL